MTELTAQLAQHDDPEFLYKDWFFGTPDIVAEKIYRMTQYVGVSYLNCTFNLGQIPHDKIMRSMELFATKVMPHFRGYVPNQAKYPRQAAAKTHRPLDDVLTEAVAAVAPALDTSPGALRSALVHLAYLNDAALWQAARATMPAEQRQRLEALHDKQQRGDPLTVEEREEEEALALRKSSPGPPPLRV